MRAAITHSTFLWTFSSWVNKRSFFKSFCCQIGDFSKSVLWQGGGGVGGGVRVPACIMTEQTKKKSLHELARPTHSWFVWVLCVQDWSKRERGVWTCASSDRHAWCTCSYRLRLFKLSFSGYMFCAPFFTTRACHSFYVWLRLCIYQAHTKITQRCCLACRCPPPSVPWPLPAILNRLELPGEQVLTETIGPWPKILHAHGAHLRGSRRSPSAMICKCMRCYCLRSCHFRAAADSQSHASTR